LQKAVARTSHLDGAEAGIAHAQVALPDEIVDEVIHIAKAFLIQDAVGLEFLMLGLAKAKGVVGPQQAVEVAG